MTAGVRYVLLRPRLAENVGAAARALKNCGQSEWVWVSPGFEDLQPARKLAVHADEWLDRVQLRSSLAEAVSDCVWVVGTSSRTVRGKRRLTPRAVAQEAVERGATVAI